MAYFPAVGRLDCGSSSAEHHGFWQLNGYGLLAIYKSDWDRFGGEYNPGGKRRIVFRPIPALLVFVHDQMNRFGRN